MRGLKIALMLVALVAMVHQSEQFDPETAKLLSHKTKSYKDDVPYFGLVFSGYATEKAFNESGFFTFDSYIDILGRRFVSGTIYGSPVVYVRSASTPSIHLGITAQIMVTHFKLRGIISVSDAGTTNETICLGSVVVPKDIAFTGAWNWLSKDVSANETGQLVIGDFNYPKPGENLLGSIAFEDIEIYKNEVIDSYFWIHVDREWLRYASRVEIDGGDVIVGLKGSSSDIYVNNPAYREFLFMTFGAATVDTDSAAVGLGALTNGIKFIAFKGISNKAGAGSGEDETELANANVVKALARFIWLLTVPRVPHEY